MRTVTAVALETLLDPGSSSSPSSQNGAHHRRHTLDSTSPSLHEHTAIRHSTSVARSNDPHHRHSGDRAEQQPIFISRHPREPSNASEAPVDGRGRDAQAAQTRARASANGYYIFPKLYVTPEPTQIVPTSGVCSSPHSIISSPSPYVVNHKRRDVPRLPQPPPASESALTAASNGHGASSSLSELQSRVDGLDNMMKPSDLRVGDTVSNGKLEGGLDQAVNGVLGRGEGNMLDYESIRRRLGKDGINSGEVDDFDPREHMIAGSSSDTDDTSGLHRDGSWRCHTPLGSQIEFYDAPDFLSDGSISLSSPSSQRNNEVDLRSLRLNLFEEMERRKKVEESLDHMQNMFVRIARQLSPVESQCPSISGWNMQNGIDFVAQLCQETVVMRFVSESLESDLARAEAEVVAEAIINSKNIEIGRLHGRLKYYEAMNQEMSQRNQEASELARRQRQKRKARRRWIWGCVGLSITVGASLLVYSYLPHGGHSPPLPSSEQDDPPSIQEQ